MHDTRHFLLDCKSTVYPFDTLLVGNSPDDIDWTLTKPLVDIYVHRLQLEATSELHGARAP